ncbi:hypothetical protein L1049_019282 [Liquidambar formosana]|uniref:PTC1-like winged helix-turn-helix domain-containing protein n=1 Tax=Liquidambar formosana TaxID=63359 RepID=A0AAP0X6F1_LIQFO
METPGKANPPLDEKHVMGSKVAEELLFRRIPSQELEEQRNSWSFWVVPSVETRSITAPPSNTESRDVVSVKGKCWSAIKRKGMVQWGTRRQVRFIGWHSEDNPSINVEENKERDKEEGNEEEEEGEEEAEDEEEEEEDEDEKDKEEGDEEAVRKTNRKRKRQSSSRKKRAKKAKREKEMKSSGFNNRKVFKNSIDRWSAERYKMAEENMLKILKAKGAVYGNPVLRPELRQEARKQIGDTGLLDHLLKHMAGKVAPGGAERFQRRHNAEGAMEYWIESADLIDVRKAAGVQDPYWTPPPGWKLGDNPAQDPICAMELKQLKEEMATMKRDMEELVSRKQEEKQTILTIPNSSVTNQKIDHIDGSFLTQKAIYKELQKRKAKIEEQLLQIAQSLSGMEDEVEKLRFVVDEPKSSESGALLIGSTTIPGAETEEERGKEDKGKEVVVVKVDDDEKEENKEQQVTTTAAEAMALKAEEKAAKIQRLKSGFRICKPQGTFLWPNMATMSSPQVLVQLDDLLVVPTPPSVSSSTITTTTTTSTAAAAAAAVEALPHFILSPHPHHGNGTQPPSPVKPFAQRRAVTVTRASPETGSDRGSNITGHRSNTGTPIDLNDVPKNSHNDNGFGATLPTSISTYQRRQHHSVTSTSGILRLVQSKSEVEMSRWEEGETKGLIRYCEQQQRGCSSASSWLALASPNSSLGNAAESG